MEGLVLVENLKLEYEGGSIAAKSIDAGGGWDRGDGGATRMTFGLAEILAFNFSFSFFQIFKLKFTKKYKNNL